MHWRSLGKPESNNGSPLPVKPPQQLPPYAEYTPPAAEAVETTGHPEAAEPPGPMPQKPAAPNGQHRKNPFIRRLNKTAQLPDKGIFHFQTK